MERYLQHGCVKLRGITKIGEYFEQLSKLVDCIAIFAARDTLGFYFDETLAEKIKELGLKQTLCKQHWKGYIGILDYKENIFEKLGVVNQTVECGLLVEGLIVEVKSSPFKAENVANIYINGIDYAVNKRGINIVVYDKQTDQVVDSVCFDTHMDSCTCDRKPIPGNHFDMYMQTEFEWIKNKLIEVDTNIKKNIKATSKTQLSLEKEIRAERLKIQNIMAYDRYLGNMLIYQGITEDEIKQSSPDKIKVRFYFWGGAILWNAMKTVAECFHEDSRYDVLIIVEANAAKMEKIKEVAKSGLRFCIKDKYRINDDMPDILILNQIDQYRAFDLEKVKYLAAVPFILVNGLDGVDTIKGFAMHAKPYDAIFVEKFLYEGIEKVNLLTDKFHMVGNPKFDVIYRELHGQHKVLDEKWQKMSKIEKIVLLATDHNWDNSSVTFDLYIHHLLSWFTENKEIGLIIRPHQWYPLELILNNVWSKEDFHKCMEFCNSFDNILWDDSSDYSLAYSMADAVLTDVNCGITISALSLNKPLGTLRRFDGSVCKPIYPEIVDNLYCIDSLDGCTTFLEMIKRGEDTRYDDRQQLFENYVSYFDGKNGQRIKEYIEQDYFKKI